MFLGGKKIYLALQWKDVFIHLRKGESSWSKAKSLQTTSFNSWVRRSPEGHWVH